MVLIVIAAVAAAVLAGLTVGLLVARSATARAEARAAESLDRRVTELDATRAAEREQVVTAAAEMAARMAGEQLGAHLSSGASQLDLRSKAFDDKVSGLTSTFDDKVTGLTRTLDQRVTGISDELRRMGDLVTRLQQERAQQHGQMLSGLKEATSASRALAETTGHLREALASPKARGQWGERMADDVLRIAGMVEGVTYQKQTAIDGGTIPDFTFLLPGGRHLHMDVKFPVDNYLRHLEAGTDAERSATAGAFLRDVRNRVKELAGRGYIQPDHTLDEVLLFIPNESVWTFIHEHDPSLIDLALGQKVVLCSPVTLFAVLAVVRQAVEQTRLERTSDEILTCLGGFTQQWSKFSDALDTVQKRFDTAHRGLEDLTGTRRRQLERQLDRIDDLRARRGLPDPADALGDGEGEALRRASGDVRALPGA
jgi:DNA recombination protein RmuC